MTPLIVMTGFLLVVSGGLKVRAAGRAGLGLPVLSLVELVAGVGLAFVPFVRPPGAGGGLWLIVGAVGFLLVSSVHQGLRLRDQRREREASEAGRLVTYVKYLSGSDPED